MQNLLNRQVLLRSRPRGEPKVSDFELVESPVPSPGEGEVLCRTIYLSLDPCMRGRMNDVKSYAQPAELGKPMVGGAVSEVIASSHPAFPTGSFVVGPTGWQAYALSRGAGMRKLDPKAAPLHGARRPRHARDDGIRRPPRHRPAQAGRNGRRLRRGRRRRLGGRAAREDPWVPRSRGGRRA